ncbi:hypothetical protein QZH41_005916 [Actinostola sp. cb2023]|nr:hypothetical protein QZH41_005916 [Actinostola sp. cb2023]
MDYHLALNNCDIKNKSKRTAIYSVEKRGEMGANLGIYHPTRQQITLQPRIAVDKKPNLPKKHSGKTVGFYEDNESSDSRKENHPLIRKDKDDFKDIYGDGVTSDSNRIIHSKLSKRVTLNVSGFKYQTYNATLQKFPETLLGNAEKRREYYDSDLREYFFDRNKQVFEIILYFYQSNGRLVCPPDLAPEILLEEVEFFELGETAVNAVKELLTDEEPEEPERELPKNKLQRRLWNLFEYPDSSKSARILALFSVSIIVASIVILCTETLPNFHVIPDSAITDPNDTVEVERVRTHNEFASTGREWFSNLEAGFIAWFSLEYLIRFFTSPKKLLFVRSFLNIIDILAIVPFYIDILLNSVVEDGEKLSLAFLRILRLVRVFRIFKLSRHSSGLQILGLTLRKSLRELGLLVFFLVIGVVIFSSMAYYAEAGEPDTHLGRSIPDTFWWALVTMTTVGYGDLVPKTLWGKLVGSCCALCGVLAIALPVPVIVSNFDAIYKKHRSRKIKQGPSLNPLLYDILLRLRVSKIALVGDIEKAFLNIEVQEEDKDSLRFLWADDPSDLSKISVYRFCRVVFGVSSSPFLLNATLQHHIRGYTETDPGFAQKMLEGFYVDDLVTGGNDIEEVIQLYEKAKERMQSGGFKLRKWITNDEQVRGHITREEVGAQCEKGKDEISYAQTTVGVQMGSKGQKVLGLEWEREQDKIVFDLTAIHNKIRSYIKHMRKCPTNLTCAVPYKIETSTTSRGRVAYNKTVESWSSRIPQDSWVVVESYTTRQSSRGRVVYNKTVGSWSSRIPQDSRVVVESYTTRQLGRGRVVYHKTVGTWSSRIPQDSWVVVESHTTRQSSRGRVVYHKTVGSWSSRIPQDSRVVVESYTTRQSGRGRVVYHKTVGSWSSRIPQDSRVVVESYTTRQLGRGRVVYHKTVGTWSSRIPQDSWVVVVESYTTRQSGRDRVVYHKTVGSWSSRIPQDSRDVVESYTTRQLGRGRVVYHKTVGTWSSRIPQDSWVVVESYTTRQSGRGRVVYHKTVGSWSSRIPQDSLDVVESYTTRQLGRGRVVYHKTVGTWSSRIPQDSWVVVESVVFV